MKTSYVQSHIAPVSRFILIATVVAILFFGNIFPTSATTPAGLDGVSKPVNLIIFSPWKNDAFARANGDGYGEGFHRGAQHFAIDFNLSPEGSAVYPVQSGNTIFAGSGWSSYGNTVVIRHDIGDEFYYYSQYAHLSNIDENVSGNPDIPPEIGRDQILGYEGNTGGEFGVHLHFSMRRCKKSADIWKGGNFPSELNSETICVSVVPEPLIGGEVYEGFGLNDWNGPLLPSYSETDTIPGPPTASQWSWFATQGSTTLGPGQKIMLSVDNLPSDVKEVRLTAHYSNWSTAGWDDQVWRILARCWPDVIKPNCDWNWPLNTQLSYEWDPYYGDALLFDAEWWGSGTQFINYAVDSTISQQVCISFDVFDNAGNVAYAPAGVQCSNLSPQSSEYLNTGALSVSSQSGSSARLINLLPSTPPTNNDDIDPSGSWSTPSSGQTISSSTVTLTVNASDNAGGSGVKEVRWAAKYGDQWYGVGTDTSAPYTINWDWCAAGVPNNANEDVELGFEVWDHANNKWVYSQHFPNIHIYKNYTCTPATGVNWSANFYKNNLTHWWDINNTDGFMCNQTFNQGNLDQNYGDGSPCGDATDNWVGDYRGTVDFSTGNYAFWVDHDDYLKLFIDNQEEYSVNGTHSEWYCPKGDNITLSGEHEIRVILAELGGQARVKVEWAKDNAVCDPPEDFSKSSPLNGTLIEQASSTTLSWGTASGATSYNYCIDTTNNDLCDSDIWIGMGTDTSVSLNSLDAGTTYYWQVKAYSRGGIGTLANNDQWWSFTTQSPTPPFNLLMDGGFEEGSTSPNWWTKDAWTLSYSTFTWDDSQKHSGNKSVKISNNTANDARWIQTVSVQPNSDYRLSGWIKTENVSHTLESVDAGANLSVLGEYEYSTPLFGTNDWTYTTLEFNTGQRTQVSIVARVGMYSGTNTGTAWFDDLKLELLSTPSCHTLTQNVNTSAGGVIYTYPTPNCNYGTEYIHGTVVQLTPFNNNGYDFDNWSGDSSGSSNPEYITMTLNKAVTANFIQSNDHIEYATDIINQTNYQNSINTEEATSSASDPALPAQCGITGSGQATVWYKYYLESDDAISIDTKGTDYDTFIAIWEGTDINDLKFVACNDDIGGTKQSAVAIRVAGDKTYYIEIGQP
jgi:murein DD-endopeptidase MepM/ murein hydrolase activator NlpD